VCACGSKTWISLSARLFRGAKGMEGQVTMLPESLIVPLQDHLQGIKRLHEEDLAKGHD